MVYVPNKTFDDFSGSEISDSPKDPNWDDDDERFIEEEVEDIAKGDIDQENLLEPRVNASNDLYYWKENQSRFPFLARMARNFLAFQGTNRDLEGTFSKVKKANTRQERWLRTSEID